MRKIIAAGLMTGVALLGAGTAHADDSFSAEKGAKLANFAVEIINESGGQVSKYDACIEAVGFAVMHKDTDIFPNGKMRSDWSQRDALIACAYSISSE